MKNSASVERIIAVGDIHGCTAELKQVLQLRQKFPQHRWVFLGDYIDRGPDSEGVIRILRDLEAVFLLGNHEDSFLTNWRRPLDAGSRSKLLALTKISEASAQWLASSLVESHETAEYLFVHGGLDPEKPLDQQTTYDRIWTRYPGDYRHLTSKTVIHGHTPVDRPEVVGNRININTGCGGGGPLSALILPERKVYRSKDTVPKTTVVSRALALGLPDPSSNGERGIRDLMTYLDHIRIGKDEDYNMAVIDTGRYLGELVRHGSKRPWTWMDGPKARNLLGLESVAPGTPQPLLDEFLVDELARELISPFGVIESCLGKYSAAELLRFYKDAIQ